MLAHFIFNPIRWQVPSNGASKDKKHHLISGISILAVAFSLYISNPQAIFQFLSSDLGEMVQIFGPVAGGETFLDFNFYR